MRINVIPVVVLGSLIAGCSLPHTITMPRMPHYVKKRVATPYQKPTPQKVAAFNKTMSKVAMSTNDDPRYRKLALDTPQKKAWFKSLMYRLWDRQITREQFIREGLKQYPDRAYEFNYIANGFQKYS